MLAASAFVHRLTESGFLADTVALQVDLFGSLAFTGKGHSTDKAIILGLCGKMPDTVDPNEAELVVSECRANKTLLLGGLHQIGFDPEVAIRFDLLTPAKVHPNTLAFRAFGELGQLLLEERWCSIGGGFVAPEHQVALNIDPIDGDAGPCPFPFASGRELLDLCDKSGLTIPSLIRANEEARRPASAVDECLDRIIDTMLTCIDRGLSANGTLPGGLKVPRRARALYRQLTEGHLRNDRSPNEVMEFVGVYAIAVNEENAGGGRVVTAPTNGAAGIVPAVLKYYRDHCSGATQQGMRTILLAATAVGSLFKMNASISGAEVGCQGEVGVACSMAAAGLCAALGGSDAQVENAAEIGMEHNLGLTCDPVGGLVQIPCIERNAFGAVKAITAASLALRGDGNHKISLDQVIKTMRDTGADMKSKYKETSLGGLAVNFVEC